MSSSLTGEYIGCKTYGEGSINWVVVRLTAEFAKELRRVMKAWRACADAYGSNDPNISVYGPDAWWLTDLPELLRHHEDNGPDFMFELRGWVVLKMAPLAALAADEASLIAELEASLDRLDCRMSSSKIKASSEDEISFWGMERYSDEDFGTQDLPEWVLDWAIVCPEKG